MENNIIAIDLGTTRTRIVAGVSDDKKSYGLSILCYEDMPSQGMRRGAIFNKDEVSKVLNNLLLGIEKKLTDLKAKKPRQKSIVVVNLGGQSFTTSLTNATLGINGRNVTSQTLINLEKVARDKKEQLLVLNDETLTHIEPTGYSIDNEPLTFDVINRNGSQIEGRYICTSSPRKIKEIQTKAFPLKFSPWNFYTTASAKAQVLLNPAQRRDGIVLVDLGGGCTSIAVYHQDSLRYEISIPIGSDTITRDIAVGLGLSNFADAEMIKRNFGIMPEADASKHYSVKLPNGGTVKFKGQQLNYIIRARAEEIAAYVYSALQENAPKNKWPRDIKMAITGGGAKLKGIAKIMAEQIGLEVSGIQVPSIENVESKATEEFAGAIGMASTCAREYVEPTPTTQQTLFGSDDFGTTTPTPTEQPVQTQTAEPASTDANSGVEQKKEAETTNTTSDGEHAHTAPQAARHEHSKDEEEKKRSLGGWIKGRINGLFTDDFDEKK